MARFLKLSIILTLIALLAGCSSSRPTPEQNAQKLFQSAERLHERGLWEDAIAAWEQVRDTYFTPELSMLAELKIAETYYLAERYPEAATSYSAFLRRYPNDFRTSTVLFRLGQSYYRQILSRDRDQTNTRNALNTFEDFIRKYPNDPNVAQAAQLALRARTRLADHEVYVGRFYLQRKHYQPAIQRLENILTRFPDYYYRDEAFFFLGRAYLAAGQTENARQILTQLVEEFPTSTYFAKANKLLDQKS
ncbi:MAG: outer membrane protein assembly factor BamD [Desulfuromonadaceae bacterium]|nr:outer membrane protein assembly factor BamD [Desulfuromonadaceae bacterium]